MTKIGVDGERWETAHGVELLLEHKSIPFSELVERIAFALRNEVTFRNMAPLRDESVS